MNAIGIDEQSIFEVARKIDSLTARDAYFAQVCGNDSAIEQRVRALLKAYEESASFLETSPAALNGDDAILERPGSVIGPSS